MKKVMTLLAMGTVCLLLTVGSASAATDVSIDSVAGTFTNPSAVIPPVSGVGTNEIRWGVPDPSPGPQSGLRFDGAATPFFADFGVEFLVGTLTHYNNPIQQSNQAPGSVDLNIDMGLTPPGSAYSFTYGLKIDETNNGQDPAPGEVPDVISIIPGTEVQVQGGYRLTLIGFKVGGVLSDEFSSPEGGTNTADLYGVVEQTIPAPSAILLGSLGALLLRSFRRRFV